MIRFIFSHVTEILGSFAALVLIATLMMPYRHQREKWALVLCAGMLGGAAIISQFYHPAPNPDYVSLFVLIDFVIAVTAFMIFLRRPRTWTLVLTTVTLIVMLLDMFGASYSTSDPLTQFRWALFGNCLYIVQLCSVLFGASQYKIERMLLRARRRKDPTYGSAWTHRRKPTGRP